MKKFLLILSSLFFLLSCNNNSEKDCYEIYNSVLKEKVSTYGIMANYLFSKNHPKKDFAIIAKKVSDSLKDSKSLTYYLEDKLTILDTLNPNDTFLNDGITVESRPNIQKIKLIFQKLKNYHLLKD